MASMERMWQFYCAPESQKGLVSRTSGEDATENAVTIVGNFSWGVTPKLEKADKDKIKEKLRKKAYAEKTSSMGRV